MVFGFGFNKAKVLASAEKNVKQGKLHNAVGDYEKILNEDPKDLTVMNTVGDLYARIGNTAKAIEYFRKVGDVYARDGFTVKAIAMYKKLTKQDPSALEINIKLAELYTQQGLYNDARSHYMQVADCNLRNGDMQATARIFQKMLELDPENVSLQGRLAEIYAKLGKTAEARDLYFRNAEAFRTRGSLDLADDALANVLKLDPKFSQAIQLRAAVKLQSGDPEAAIELLEKMPDLDSRSDALRTLLAALLQMSRIAEADPVARKLLRVFDDASGIISYADALMSSGSCEPALQLYREHADRLLVADMTGLMESLQASIAKVKSSSPALEILADLFQRAGKTMYVVEVTELLAHALVQEGQLSKACELYKKLVDLEPENPQHAQSYQQLTARLGRPQPSGPAPLDDAPQTFAIEEIQCGTQLQQDYPVELQEAIDAAFTDAELFDSYNLAPKAILPLEAVLPRVPNDVRINFRLASLYARSGRLKDAAARCRVLEGVYREAGYTADANQFSDLMRRYLNRAGTADEVPAPAAQAPAVALAPPNPTASAFEISEATPAIPIENTTVAAPASSSTNSAAKPVTAELAHEFDLSDEWEDAVEVEESTESSAGPGSDSGAPAAVEDSAQTAAWDSFEAEDANGVDGSLSDLLEEIRFYLSQKMWAEARSAVVRCEGAAPNSAELAALKADLAAGEFAAQAHADEVEPGVKPTNRISNAADIASTDNRPVESQAVPSENQAGSTISDLEAVAKTAPFVEAATDDVLGGMVFDLEASLGDNFAIEAPPVAPKATVGTGAESGAATATTPVPAIAIPAPMQAAESAAPASESSHPATAPAVEAEQPNALSDIFAEFKESMEQGEETGEDPETHYNLGVAFKEMGLYDEAIGELQKVCQTIDRGHAFPQAMQAYTWLADCFLHQGVPEAAVRWYEKALRSSHIDDETATAIHFELACAQEAAGNRTAALSHFMEVYGTNIDYRDVAERIKALKS